MTADIWFRITYVLANKHKFATLYRTEHYTDTQHVHTLSTGAHNINNKYFRK